MTWFRQRILIVGLIGAIAAFGAPTSGAALATAQGVHSHGHHHAHHPRLIKAKRVRPHLAKFRSYVKSLINQLGPQVTKLEAFIAIGDVADAKSAWLAAHLTWLRIGEDNGAYGAFGALGRRIDGTAAGLRGGTSDTAFMGFHKIEFDLWSTNNLVRADIDAANLADDIQELSRRPLKRTFPGNAEGVANWILRSHEVIEDAVRDSLSGDDDYGSGTDAASVGADTAAAKKILKLLTPLLRPRASHLVRHAHRDLRRVTAAVRHSRVGGKWVALTAMPRYQREVLASAAGAADETLAPVPDLLPIRAPRHQGGPIDVT